MPFVVVKPDGTVKDLAQCNRRELTGMYASLEKTYEAHKRRYPDTFDPPSHDRDRCHDELLTNMGALTTYRDFCRAKGVDLPPRMGTFLEQYRRWLSLGPDSQSLEDISFADAQDEEPDDPPANRDQAEEPALPRPPTGTQPSTLQRFFDLPRPRSTPPGYPSGSSYPTETSSSTDQQNRPHHSSKMLSGIPELTESPKRGQSLAPALHDQPGATIFSPRPVGSEAQQQNGTRNPARDAEQQVTWRWPIDGEDERLSGVSMGSLTRIVEAVLRASNNSSPRVSDSCHYSSRKRYHLLELEKFSGKIEEYPIFRQNLSLCLEREHYQDERDKALFVLRHLEGNAKTLVNHLVRPLTDGSFRAIINKLDRTFGQEHELDRALIREIYRLPRVTELTPDNLIHMITVLEAALPAMARREPETLRLTDSDKLIRVLGLIPLVDRDFFFSHCTMTNQVANLMGFVQYLNHKFDMRKTTQSVSLTRTTVQPKVPPKTKPAEAPRQRVYLTNPTPEDAPEGDKSGDEEEDEIDLKLAGDARPGPRFPCKLCEGPHGLAGCEKFKILDIHGRRSVVNEAKACSSCLSPGHFARDCRRKRSCPVEGCDRSHHPLLHDDYVLKVKFFEELGRGFSPEEFLERPL